MSADTKTRAEALATQCWEAAASEAVVFAAVVEKMAILLECAEKAEAENARLRAALEEMVASMVKYEMDVDDGLEFGPPRRHREMMRRAQAALNRENVAP